MVLGSTDANRVLLVAEGLVMEEEADLNLFYITDHQLVNVSHPRKGVTMEIKLKRKIMGEMMTTYLPSMLLMMITYATTFFRPFFFECEPDHHAGDDHHLHQQDGGLAPHL